MGLIDLKTNLKDLKFGKDERGGGSSNQPYIQTKIPATDEPLQTGASNVGPVLASLGAGAAIGAIGGSALGNTGAGAVIGAAAGIGIGIIGANLTTDGFRLPNSGTGGPDFLIRGGTLLLNAIVNDEIRLTKFFASTEGLLFVTKQNLLSRIAVRTQTSNGLLNDGVYTPISTLVQAAGNPFGLHVNKQGLNPFAGTGPTSENENLYAVKVTSNQNQTDNRLVNLYGAKILINPNRRFSDSRFTNNDISPDRLYVLSYSGGPNSFLGIGKTKIRLTSPTINITPDEALSNPNINYLTLGNRGLNTALSPTEVSSTNLSIFPPLGLPFNIPIPNVISSEYELTNSRNVNTYIPTQNQIDFRKSLIDRIKGVTTLMSKAPSYDPGDNKIIEQRVNLGDPGNASGKNLYSYTNGANGNGAASQNSFDKINAFPIYINNSAKGTINPDNVNNDLVKFRIGVINNNNPSQKTYIHFRAFLDNISDQYSSEWNSTQYTGRGEKFYTYGGFDRKISLSWTVAAQSKVELIPMYKKLNYLASICAPDYSGYGYMRGNIITLTVGGYLYEQPGIITSLNYDMNEENDSWEIGINDEGESDPSVKELPHIIRVKGFNFIPIHSFVPRLQQNSYGVLDPDEPLMDNNIYGQEKYIALSAGGIDNYRNTSPVTLMEPISVTSVNR